MQPEQFGTYINVSRTHTYDTHTPAPHQAKFRWCTHLETKSTQNMSRTHKHKVHRNTYTHTYTHSPTQAPSPTHIRLTNTHLLHVWRNTVGALVEKQKVYKNTHTHTYMNVSRTHTHDKHTPVPHLAKCRWCTRREPQRLAGGKKVAQMLTFAFDPG